MSYNKSGEWIDARFGDSWIDRITEEHDKKDIAHIALLQGRRAIDYREALEQILENSDKYRPEYHIAKKVLERPQNK